MLRIFRRLRVWFDFVELRLKKCLIDSVKGEYDMSDNEKFEGLKRSLVDENERNYGEETRKRYGSKAVDESNAKFMGLSEEQYGEAERLRLRFEETLQAAFGTGDPAGELARQACELHRQWLGLLSPVSYDRQYHRALGEMYVNDERFRANYDKLAPGCTEFLRDAINIYCK